MASQHVLDKQARAPRARGAALALLMRNHPAPCSVWFYDLLRLAERAKTREAELRLEALADIMFDLACAIEGPASVGGVEV